MRTPVALSNEQLARVAPSILAQQAWDGVSDRYTFIPTIDIVEALRAEGFLPVFANQSVTRVEGKRAFAKHVLRFQRAQDMVDRQAINPGHFFYERNGQLAPEIPQLVLTNSHERSSGFRLDAGIFRLVCSNGLTVQSSDLGSISVRHSGNIKDQVLDGCCRIIEDMPMVLGQIDAMKAIQLDQQEREIFAKAAIELRYPTDETTGKNASPILPARLLTIRHREDTGHGDLWTTFNAVQENFIKGGIRGVGTTGKRTSTRAITAVSEDIRLNKALWSLAEQMKALKTA